MRPLGWMLIHWPATVSLAGLQRQLAAELALRARCGAAGQPSPHQLPPGGLTALTFALLSAAALLYLTR